MRCFKYVPVHFFHARGINSAFISSTSKYPRGQPLSPRGTNADSLRTGNGLWCPFCCQMLSTFTSISRTTTYFIDQLQQALQCWALEKEKCKYIFLNIQQLQIGGDVQTSSTRFNEWAPPLQLVPEMLIAQREGVTELAERRIAMKNKLETSLKFTGRVSTETKEYFRKKKNKQKLNSTQKP